MPWLKLFQKRHSCSGTGYEYAVDYALKFCNLYSENQHMFLPKGQRWINAVRKCLQVKLVPFLRPYVKINCAKIQAFAFRTHTPCYLHPYPGGPSICDLDCVEWAKVFWTIKGAYITATSESLRGMWSVTKGCASLSSLLTHVTCTWAVLKAEGRAGMRLVRFVIRKVNAAADWFKHLIEKRSAPLDFDEVAGNIADQLAVQLGWEKDGVQWFAFVGNNSMNISNADEIDINILLGSRAEYDLNAVGVPEADMNKTVDDLAEAIGNEQIHLDVGKNLNVTQFSACLDTDCQDTYHDVIPKLKKPKPHDSGSSAISKRTVLMTVPLIIKVLLS